MSNKKKLKEQVLSGLFWTFGERILAQGVSFVLSIILARLLFPEEYGLVALVLVFINLANVFVSSGFGEALIQKKDASELDFSTVFYCSFALSWGIFFLLFFIAPILEEFYGMHGLSTVLRVLALKIPISSVSTVQHAYVSKHMIFKKFFFSTLGGTLFSGIAGVAMAFAGFGVWALVAQYLLNTSIDTAVLFVTVPWRPKLMFSYKRARELIGYGWKLTAAGLINMGYIELRSLIIGKKYLAADLAYYNRGNQFPSLIITNIDSSIAKVAFPAMSETKHDLVRLKSICRKSMKATSYIIFPLLIGLMVTAETLVSCLLTDKWLACVPYLQIGCVFYLCQPIQTTNWQVIKALGRSDLCFKLEIVKKTIGILLIFLSMNYGVLAIAYASACTGVISMIINMLPNKALINYSISEEFRDILPPFLASAVMGIMVYGISYLNFSNILTLVFQVLFGVIAYIGISHMFKIGGYLYLLETSKSIIERKRNKRCKHDNEA